MNGVAAELAVEVLVRFQQQYVHPLSGEQQPQHDAGRSAASDAAIDSLDRLVR